MGSVIILILFGIILFLVEFLLIPGITIAGIGGAILTIWGIYMAFDKFGNETGSIVLVSTLVISIFIFALSLRARTWKRAILNTNIDSRVNEIPEIIKPGDIGVAITRLAPMGTIRVHDNAMEAKCESGYVNPRTEIVVTKVTASQITVKPLN